MLGAFHAMNIFKRLLFGKESQQGNQHTPNLPAAAPPVRSEPHGSLASAEARLERSLSAQGPNVLLLAEAQAVVNAAAGKGVSEIVGLLDHSYFLVRAMACEAIMDADYMPACSKLAHLLRDENQSVRLRAKEAIESIHRTTLSDQQVEALYKSASTNQTSGHDRQQPVVGPSTCSDSLGSVAQKILDRLPTPSWVGCPVEATLDPDTLVATVNQHRDWIINNGLTLESMEGLTPLPRGTVYLALKQLVETRQASVFILIAPAAPGHPKIPSGARVEFPLVVRGELPWFLLGLQPRSANSADFFKSLCPEL